MLHHGFKTLKDILDVIVLPIIVALIAIYLPSYIENLKKAEHKRTFEEIISRELHEIEPHPKNKLENGNWHSHLIKQNFVHHRILEDASENRDFILSLNTDQVYLLNQLWAHYEMAASDTTNNEHLSKKWLSYYKRLCFDHETDKSKCSETYDLWKSLIAEYLR